MPYAYNVYTGNGSATQYTIGFPYIRKEHVKVFVNYVDTTFTFANDTTAQLSSAPANGVRVEVRRVTPADNVLVDYTDGSTLTAADLDTNALQQLYLDQELDDAQKQVVTISGTTGAPTLSNQRLTEVSDPTGAQDAATKNYVDTNFQPLDAELTELATMSSGTASALADLTQTETQILDGATVTTAELNTLDGITASTAELNKLDGVTADTAELNKLDGVTASTAELNILDGVTATAAEINKLDGVTASTSELNTLDGVTATAAEINKLDGVTATTAELNFVDGVTSAIQNQIDGKQPLDSELTELSTMQSGTASALADLTQAEVQVLDGATLSTAELNKLDGVTSTTNELNILDGVTANTTELNVTDGLTASTAELNQLDGKTISSTLTPANTNDIPTSSAVNTFVSGLLNALGGFVAIPNETSFPTTNPDPSDNAGTVVSIADAGGVVVDANGASTTGRTTGNVTVTITGFPSSLQSTTLAAGLGLQVQTTTTLNTYTYHKLIAKETDVVQLSDDINDFQARYRVSDSAPTTDLDEGDLWYDKTANKMKVYDTSTSAWKEVQSIGNFVINTLSSSSGTGGGSATFNGSAYRFTLSDAGANAQQMLVSVNGVIQKPNSGTSQPSEGYALDSNDIIFAAAPASNASFFIVTIGSTVNIGTPSNNTVDTAQLVDGSVTTAKLGSASVTAAKLANTSVTAGSYTLSSITVDAQGRITAASSGSAGAADKIEEGNTNVECVDTGSDGHILFDTEGTERMRIDSSGNVGISSGNLGIGTTSPGRNLVVNGGSSEGVLQITNNTSGTGNANGLEILCFTSGEAQFLNRENAAMRFDTNNTERMRIDSSGNVGIGSTSPEDPLHIKSNSGAIRLENTVVSNNDSTISYDDDTLAIHVDPNNVRGSSRITFSGDGNERMRIDSSGRVSIGTTSADSNTRLHVSAAEGTSDPMATDASIVIANTQNAGQQEAAALKFNVGNTNTASISAHYDQFSAGVNSSLRFYTQYQSAFNNPTERMRIRPDGSIQLGSDPPVSGNTSVTGFRFVYGQGFWWSTQGANSYWNTSSGTVWNFRVNGSQKGSINIHSNGTSFNTSSDYRLKENVVNLNGAINRVKQLAPKRFNFIGNKDTTVDGFLAHEAQTVVPEAVTGTHNEVDDDGNAVMQGIDQAKLVPLLTAALQEAIAKIETLETQNASLEARLTALEGAS